MDYLKMAGLMVVTASMGILMIAGVACIAYLAWNLLKATGVIL